ncbi:MAG: Molybdenum cofactor biosynthesis protein B [Synergistetes bacterium ADurb.Bin155]|uniref:MogA/MoaB family molybdenum cofactor biosynthesis protein n=1 Tax=Methanoculleus sp. TaxID=90427 RepID=UPI0009C527EB|nr:molybdenum cofactor biosynthesis protein B [Methanoculleus sp.]OPZ61574.1 MAG: Molybdenum cofactor biosynthesis protein B [Candidatus Aminicenantes bacterium ADurb.Bin508]OQB43923.1 MAG: Molybdenum cofactor biosynthesis protein B [Synergistetes bacterium ADurb.Bin155]HNT07773.1 molybdenum cofactor biosynthesis protein B [Methanoculleus sp.]HNV39011.1 molybdenum cofactor biosynthesis protein B [Methanoculleus sp.]
MESNHLKPLTVTGAVITVSSSRKPGTDASGKALIDLLSADGIEVTHYAVVPDDVARIRAEVSAATSRATCVIVTGGTGLTPDDVTIEAVAPLLAKTIDGFGELFRLKSYEEIGTAAILSRAIAGVIDGRAVFCIPGSTKAVTLAAREIIIPEIRHILTHASSGQR